MTCIISSLTLHPVKSCRGTSVQSVSVGPRGLEGDRQLMVTRGGGMINQKEIPKLARVEVVQQTAGEIEFRSEGVESLQHSVRTEADGQTAGLYFDQVPVIGQGQQLNEWISAVTGEALEVVALAEPMTRDLPVEQLAAFHGARQENFADLAPILLTNQASLDDLNNRIDTPVAMDQFRGNLVVEGIDPWAEDEISEYRIGDLRLVSQVACERCAVTCTDQITGERSGQPIRGLGEFRRIEGGYASGIPFGVYMSIEGEGTLSVGDTLELA